MTRQIPAGVIPVERALPGVAIVDEMRRRGFDLRTEIAAGASASA